MVLTSEGSTASDTFGASIAGFISALPDYYIRDWVARLYFQVKSDRRGGIVKRAPYGIAKVHASLARAGIDAVIADPNKLDKVVGGPSTKVLGIYTMDAGGAQLRIGHSLLDIDAGRP